MTTRDPYTETWWQQRIEKLEAINAELLAACEAADGWWERQGGARWAWVDSVQAAIAKAKEER